MKLKLQNNSILSALYNLTVPVFVAGTVVFSGFFSPKSAAQPDKSCLISSSGYKVVSGVYDWTVDQSTYSVSDKVFSFHFVALLLPTNQLWLSIQLADHKEKVRSEMSGKKLYQQAIDHFGKENIRHIIGSFSEGDNHRTMELYESQGLSLKEAAHKTWSGQMAASYGFTEVISATKEYSVALQKIRYEVLFGRSKKQ